MATELEDWQEIRAAAVAGLKKVLSGAQEYSAGVNLLVRRALVKDFNDTIARADAKIKELGGGSSIGSGFDPANAAVFVRPR